jgi:hypothetical protein
MWATEKTQDIKKEGKNVKQVVKGKIPVGEK